MKFEGKYGLCSIDVESDYLGNITISILSQDKEYAEAIITPTLARSIAHHILEVTNANYNQFLIEALAKLRRSLQK